MRLRYPIATPRQQESQILQGFGFEDGYAEIISSRPDGNNKITYHRFLNPHDILRVAIKVDVHRNRNYDRVRMITVERTSHRKRTPEQIREERHWRLLREQQIAVGDEPDTPQRRRRRDRTIQRFKLMLI